MSYGIVDIGSNTVKLNVYRCKDNEINLIFTKKENLGLVFYVKKQMLTDEGIEKLVSVLKDLKDDLDFLNVESYSFFATASLRNIENSDQVIKIIKDRVNIEIDVISGKQEGELSFLGSVSKIKEDDGILIDVGGGSVEVVLFKNKEIEEKNSIPVGSLKMYDKYVSYLVPNPEECDQIKERVCFELKKIDITHREKIPFLCGVGGSIRAIEQILVDLNLQSKTDELIDVKLLSQLRNELNHNNKETYNKILHVKPSRIHVIVPTLLIMESIISYFGSERLQVSKFSVREGYLYKKMLNRCPK